MTHSTVRPGADKPGTPDPADIDVLDIAPIAIAVYDRGTDTLEILSGDENAEPSSHEARVLIREDGHTLGYREVTGSPFVPLDEQELHRLAQAEAAGLPGVQRAWTQGAGAGLSASLILCTMGRNPLLPRAVAAALTQTHNDLEVIVVDNAPATGDTRRALAGIEDPRLRIVDEPRGGLSHARNRGVAAAQGEIIAFSDDDAQVHPEWMASILDVFAAAPAGQIGAVTGPVFPAQLRYPSQFLFEDRGGFPKQVRPTVWASAPQPAAVRALGDPGEGGPFFPLTTARVGAGVSMAYPRAVLSEMGEFDTALGAGSLTKGGEDLDAFARVLRAGRAIITTPDAVVHHTHRENVAGLIAQSYGDGTGMAALLTKAVTHHPAAIALLARRIPRILRRIAPGSERVQGNAGSGLPMPPQLLRQEIRGFLRGPVLYAQARWATRAS